MSALAFAGEPITRGVDPSLLVVSQSEIGHSRWPLATTRPGNTPPGFLIDETQPEPRRPKRDLRLSRRLLAAGRRGRRKAK